LSSSSNWLGSVEAEHEKEDEEDARGLAGVRTVAR